MGLLDKDFFSVERQELYWLSFILLKGDDSVEKFIKKAELSFSHRQLI